jgi:hypothetical protein
LNGPVPVYGAVPPVAVTVTVDVPPLQSMGVKDEAATKPAAKIQNRTLSTTLVWLRKERQDTSKLKHTIKLSP